ncbi:SusE domain-containing protein [Pontibacter mangrovi]|uniref:SusF/SusE family outer membrane protein n=1 Tax=Pontibacter mangrovi TaxID=2589816 RepID=A0A501W8U0_9BACT|nr:SusE domain-containing protein [Pontibacter mangrovi]TPE46363.1 SusF/SusE family outer membrane protein [Pontibacter mangrovi]
MTMKIWLNKISLLCLLAVALFSCDKDEERLVLRPGDAPVLTASTDNIVLTEEQAGEEAVTLSWGEADYGYKAAVEYWLQIDTAGDNFVDPYNVSLGNESEKVYTVEELNTLLTKLKYTPEEAHDISIRIKATVSDLVSPMYSNTTTVNVTPYSTYVEPGYVYVPGDYQGWNPGTAPALISVEDNGIYQGVISFVDAGSLEFKITAGRNWDLNYGAGDAAGTLAVNGSNLTVPAKDSYMITVDLNAMTWSAAKHSWGLIGNATAGGWDADTNMKYDNEEGVWKLTTDLTAGEIKFRFNDDWAVNYGEDNGDNVLEQGGTNIVISDAGTYEIVLDLENEDETVTYTITKQ